MNKEDYRKGMTVNPVVRAFWRSVFAEAYMQRVEKRNEYASKNMMLGCSPVPREDICDGAASDAIEISWRGVEAAYNHGMLAIDPETVVPRATSESLHPKFPETLARFFHEAYERLAPNFGYKTREATAKPWDKVPENNKQLMIAVCTELISNLKLT